MKGALSKGSTGDELLAILEAIVGNNDEAQEAQYGTLEEQTFWYSRLHIGGQNLMAFVTLWVVTVCYTEGAICPLPENTVIVIWGVMCYIV